MTVGIEGKSLCMRTGSEIDCLGPQPRRPVPARSHESRSVDIIWYLYRSSLFRKRAHFIVVSASFSELGDNSIMIKFWFMLIHVAWSGFTVILMLPNTSGAWAGTGVLDSKVARGVSLLYFRLFDIMYSVLIFPPFFAYSQGSFQVQISISNSLPLKFLNSH